MRKKVLVTLFLAAFSVALAEEPCPGDGSIRGKWADKNKEKAKLNAEKDIAEQISSALRSASTEFAVVETSGSVIEKDYNKFLQTAKVDAYLPNKQYVKQFREPYRNEDGEWVYELYICRSHAAKPYLDSLEIINMNLSNKKISTDFCKDFYETYAPRVMSFEGIAERFGQIGKAQTANYKEIEKECGKAAKGIYVESNSNHFTNKIGSMIANEGCILAENTDNSALSLKINVEYKQIIDEFSGMFCNANVKINLQSNKTGKSLYIDEFLGSKGSWTDMENDCKITTEKTAAEAWERIKGKINKGECR